MPMKPRYLAIPLLLAVLALLIFIQIASHRITSPQRATLHDSHFEIMAEPANHGMKLSYHTAPDGTPYLLCEGLRTSGKKGLLLRQQLSAKKVQPIPEPAALLLLHGHGSRKEHHLAIAERFCAVGFTCLIPDLPGHGEHPDEKGTFGKKEVPRLRELLTHVHKEHQLPEKIGLFGLSQGGAIALQLAAADHDSFTSVATVSTFADLAQTLESTAHRKSPVLAALLPVIQLDLKLRHQLSVKEISPAQSATKINLPVFVIHGLDDTFIPPSNAETIYRNLSHPEKRLRFVPQAGHGNVLAKGDLIYAELCEFFLTSQPFGVR